MGKRVFLTNGTPAMAAATPAPRAVAPVVAPAVPVQQAVSPKAKTGVGSVILYSALPLLVVGGCIMGFMALQSNAEVDSVVSAWDDVRSLADVQMVYSDITDPSDENFVDTSFGNFIISGTDGNNSGSSDGNNDDSVAGVVAPSDEDSDDQSTTNDTIVEQGDESATTSETSSSSSNAPVANTVAVKPMERRINWEAVQSANIQTSCWLYVPGTLIDYPIIQEKTVGAYAFLDHDFYNRESKSGCLVTPALPDGANTDAHFIILGHNMKNATMFGTLRYYRTQDFYKSYPYIYIYYPDRVEKWAVWSCYHTTDADIIYDAPYELNSTAFSKLLKQINSQKSYATNIDNTDASKGILTLSTCEKIDDTHKGRFVVNAVLAETVKY